MARLARTVRALATLLFFVGIVLLPLRAAAATVPMLIAYDVAALSTTTMPVERPDTVRREVEPASNDYDRACVGCDDPWDPPVAAGAADIHADDDTLELLERRERAKGAIYGFVEPTTAAEGLGPTAARTFTSSDPLVADLANSIEAAYPGHVVGVNVPMYNAAGELATDADILLQNAVIQVKSGSGAGLTSQLARTQAVTDLPVIGYGPQLGGAVFKGIQAAGGLVTRDAQLLIGVVAP